MHRRGNTWKYANYTYHAMQHFPSDKNIRLEKYQVMVRVWVNKYSYKLQASVKIGIDILRGYLAVLTKMKIGINYDPGIPFLGIHPKETPTYVHRAIHWSIICNTEKYKTPTIYQEGNKL